MLNNEVCGVPIWLIGLGLGLSLLSRMLQFNARANPPTNLRFGFEYLRLMNWHSISSQEFLFKNESTISCTQYHNARDSNRLNQMVLFYGLFTP